MVFSCISLFILLFDLTVLSINIFSETRCGQYFGLGTGKLWRFQIDSSTEKMTSFHLFDDESGEHTDVVLNVS